MIYGDTPSNNLTITGKATNVPIELPRLVNTTTSRIRVTLFLQNPLTERISSGSFSKSFTFGLREKASTSPDTQPAAIIGFNEVKGAASMEVIMVTGCARAIIAPMPAKIALAAIHQIIMSLPAWVPP